MPLNKKTLIILFSLLTLLFIPQVKTVFAQEETVYLPVEKTLPTSSLYPFKRLWEKVRLTLTLTQNGKLNYKKLLMEKRLSELVSLVNNKDTENIERASQRFAYQAGVYAEQVQKNNHSTEEALETFGKYKRVFPRLRDHYPANGAYWLSIQQDLDTLNILSDEIK